MISSGVSVTRKCPLPSSDGENQICDRALFFLESFLSSPTGHILVACDRLTNIFCPIQRSSAAVSSTQSSAMNVSCFPPSILQIAGNCSGPVNAAANCLTRFVGSGDRAADLILWVHCRWTRPFEALARAERCADRFADGAGRRLDGSSRGTGGQARLAGKDAQQFQRPSLERAEKVGAVDAQGQDQSTRRRASSALNRPGFAGGSNS